MAKTAIITGCSSGIGRATAHYFGKNGWNVAATMRSKADAGDLLGHENVIISRLDLTDNTSIIVAIKEAVDRFGQIDVVVNCAGFGQFGIFERIPAERIEQNFAVNVFGTMNVIREIIPVFREQGEGVIVNLSSVGGLVGLPAMTSYVSTKFAVEGFSEALSHELRSQNIIVKLVEPGGVETEFDTRAAATDTGTGGLKSYTDFLARTAAAVGKFRTHSASPADVAELLFEAASDGTGRLRYLPDNAVKQFVDARKSMGDADYENYMRSQFA